MDRLCELQKLQEEYMEGMRLVSTKEGVMCHADIIKDLAQAEKYISEAMYYRAIAEAMKDEDKSEHLKATMDALNKNGSLRMPN